MATHSNVLAWRIPGMGEPGGLPSMGLQQVLGGGRIHILMSERIIPAIGEPLTPPSFNCALCLHKRRLYTWTSPDGQQRNQIDYILCSQRWRSSIRSTKTRPGDNWGSGHELLITKFRLK